MLFVLFVIGLFFGSFFLVVADRIERGQSFIFGRSECDNCHHILSWIDLLPVFSFVLSRGTCRYCHTHLSVYYPLSEMLTGVLFALTYVVLFHTNTWIINDIPALLRLLFYLYIVSSLIIIFFADLRYGIIPFAILFPAFLLTGIYLLITQQDISVHLLAGSGAFLFFLLLHLGTRGRGMGLGDVVLAFFMGLLLGFPSIVVALYIAFLTGAVISLILILGGKKRFRGSTIPFGPFLVCGTYLCLLWGNELVYLLLRLLHII